MGFQSETEYVPHFLYLQREEQVPVNGRLHRLT